jgi:ATP-dependent protease ClpP protease subunit
VSVPSGLPQPVAPVPVTPILQTYLTFAHGITHQSTQALLTACAELVRQKVNVVYLIFTTLGGGVMEGITLHNILRAMPFKLITHNVGNIDSIGNVIFLAGDERYASATSTFMFHGVHWTTAAQAADSGPK